MHCVFSSIVPQFVFFLVVIGSSFVNAQEPTLNPEAAATQELSEAETLAIAREAYGYGLPIVEGYKNIYVEAIDKEGDLYKAPLNVLYHEAKDLADFATMGNTPNLDLLRSWVWMDLRAEPVVLEVPETVEGRYFSIQLVDLYTFNVDYIHARESGGAGRYLIAGPDWKGEMPEGIDEVIRCETRLAGAKYRLQVRGVADMETALEIQSQFKVQTLSSFLGQPAAEPAPIDFPRPDSATAGKVDFFETLNFLLKFCPTHPSEVELMERFARIGLGANAKIEFANLSDDIRASIKRGMEEADAAIAAAVPTFKSAEIFGNREFLANDYLKRAVAAKVGLYGNSREETMYPLYLKDGEGNSLDASKNRYVLKLPADDLPPVNSFWSITMYDSQTQRPVANPISRFQINSEMLSTLSRDDGGGVTLYIQQESPGETSMANWLPAPNGPFYLVLRLYQPKPMAYEGTWSPALVFPETATPEMDVVKPTGVEVTDVVQPSTLVDENKPEMERPTVWGEPTEVQIGIYIIDVDEVDSADQSFAASVFYQARWKNPLLRHKGPGPLNRGLSDVWNPRLIIVGQQMAWKSYPESVEIMPDGTVIYRQRVWGRFSQPLALKNFPFDQQTLSVQIVAAGLREDHIKMVPLVTDTGRASDIAGKFSLPDFDVVSWEAVSSPYLAGQDTTGLAGYEMKINIARQPAFYILKVIVPLCLIVIMSWLPRWIDPEQSGTNIGISTSAFLTLVAYLFAITVLLPRVSYVTRIDRFILLSTLTVFTGLLQTVANTAMLKNGKKKWVERLDFAARFLYPALLALVIVYSFVM